MAWCPLPTEAEVLVLTAQTDRSFRSFENRLLSSRLLRSQALAHAQKVKRGTIFLVRARHVRLPSIGSALDEGLNWSSNRPRSKPHPLTKPLVVFLTDPDWRRSPKRRTKEGCDRPPLEPIPDPRLVCSLRLQRRSQRTSLLRTREYSCHSSR